MINFVRAHMVFKIKFSELKSLYKVALRQLAVDPGKVVCANHERLNVNIQN